MVSYYIYGTSFFSSTGPFGFRSSGFRDGMTTVRQHAKYYRNASITFWVILRRVKRKHNYLQWCYAE